MISNKASEMSHNQVISNHLVGNNPMNYTNNPPRRPARWIYSN
ncbi:hypothetical protein [Paenibacillus sp. WC2504]